MARPEEHGGKPAHHRAARAEWLVAALSAALVLAMVGFVFYQAISDTGAPPRLVVRVDRVEQAGEAYRVQFRLANGGERTAAAVRVTGELRDGDRVIDRRAVSLDYVPAQSERRGALLFSHDPRRYDLQLRAEGYSDL